MNVAKWAIRRYMSSRKEVFLHVRVPNHSLAYARRRAFLLDHSGCKIVGWIYGSSDLGYGLSMMCIQCMSINVDLSRNSRREGADSQYLVVKSCPFSASSRMQPCAVFVPVNISTILPCTVIRRSHPSAG